MLRVAQFGTGFVGHFALRAIPALAPDVVCSGAAGDYREPWILAIGTRLVKRIPVVVAARPQVISTPEVPWQS